MVMLKIALLWSLNVITWVRCARVDQASLMAFDSEEVGLDQQSIDENSFSDKYLAGKPPMMNAVKTMKTKWNSSETKKKLGKFAEVVKDYTIRPIVRSLDKRSGFSAEMTQKDQGPKVVPKEAPARERITPQKDQGLKVVPKEAPALERITSQANLATDKENKAVPAGSKWNLVRTHGLQALNENASERKPAYSCSTTKSGAGCKACVAEASRTQNDQCSDCNNGYTLLEAVCQAYSCSTTASGAGCKACAAQDARIQNDHCSDCNQGYFLSGAGCQGYSCSPTKEGSGCKACVEQALRTQNDHCSTCNRFYFLSGTGCQGIETFPAGAHIGVRMRGDTILQTSMMSAYRGIRSGWKIEAVNKEPVDGSTVQNAIKQARENCRGKSSAECYSVTFVPNEVTYTFPAGKDLGMDVILEVVTKVSQPSLAADRGVEVGWKILKVNDEIIRPGERGLQGKLDEARRGREYALTFQKDKASGCTHQCANAKTSATQYFDLGDWKVSNKFYIDSKGHTTRLETTSIVEAKDSCWNNPSCQGFWYDNGFANNDDLAKKYKITFVERGTKMGLDLKWWGTVNYRSYIKNEASMDPNEGWL